MQGNCDWARKGCATPVAPVDALTGRHVSVSNDSLVNVPAAQDAMQLLFRLSAIGLGMPMFCKSRSKTFACAETGMSVRCRYSRCPGGLQIRHASFEKPSTNTQTPCCSVRGLSQGAARLRVMAMWQPFFSGVTNLRIVRQATSKVLRLRWIRR